MEKYIDLLRVIIKNFNIDNNLEFDDTIKKILNKIFYQYYNLRNEIFDNNNNHNKKSYCIDNLYKKYDIRNYELERKYRIVNNKELIFKLNKLEVDNFKIILNKNLCIVNMENYINVLRCILKNFNIRKNNEFDNIIKYVINKIFDKYYNNRDKSVYCNDNLMRRYSMRYFDLQAKYGTVKSTKMIYRFNRYSKRNYIKKLLRNHEYFYLDKDENINKLVDSILEIKPDNYKKYIEHLYLDKLEHKIDELSVELDLNNNQEENDFQIQISKKKCFYPPCLKWVIEGNYCSLHNKDMI